MHSWSICLPCKDVGDDADFERDPSPPRDIEL